MKLVSFSVNNYRSITKAYRLPIRQSTVLLGPNNEGKSNILKALVTGLEVLSDLEVIQNSSRSRSSVKDVIWAVIAGSVTIQSLCSQSTPRENRYLILSLNLRATKLMSFLMR